MKKLNTILIFILIMCLLSVTLISCTTSSNDDIAHDEFDVVNNTKDGMLSRHEYRVSVVIDPDRITRILQRADITASNYGTKIELEKLNEAENTLTLYYKVTSSRAPSFINDLSATLKVADAETIAVDESIVDVTSEYKDKFQKVKKLEAKSKEFEALLQSEQLSNMEKDFLKSQLYVNERELSDAKRESEKFLADGYSLVVVKLMTQEPLPSVPVAPLLLGLLYLILAAGATVTIILLIVNLVKQGRRTNALKKKIHEQYGQVSEQSTPSEPLS